MCGLVGISGKLIMKDESALKRLLVFDTMRGLDGTGVAAVRHNKDEVHLSKAAANPFELFQTKSFLKAVSAWDSSVFLGHNRAATTGAKTSLNTHPFTYGSITAAHNGTLTQKSWTDLEDKLGQEFDVDSQALICAIDKFGIEETISMIEEGTTSTTGAWAITWYDAKDDSINFIRNKHRPLWLSHSLEFDKVYWASEWPMIHAAMAMDDRLKELYKDENSHMFFSLPTDTWYKADLEELRTGGKECVLRPVKEIKGKEVKYAGYQSPFMGGTGTTTHTVTTTKARAKSGQTFVFTMDAEENDPFFDVMDSNDLHAAAKYGCAWCKTPINGRESGSVYIEEVNSIICPSCTGLPGHVSKAILTSPTFEAVHELVTS